VHAVCEAFVSHLLALFLDALGVRFVALRGKRTNIHDYDVNWQISVNLFVCASKISVCFSLAMCHQLLEKLNNSNIYRGVTIC
jgi:hypothetical protein